MTASGPEHDTTTPPLTDEMVIAGVSAYCDRMATGATIGQCVQAALRAALATTAAPDGCSRCDGTGFDKTTGQPCADGIGRATTADTVPPPSDEAWLLCPQHGPYCAGASCCCADLHRRASGDRPAEPERPDPTTLPGLLGLLCAPSTVVVTEDGREVRLADDPRLATLIHEVATRYSGAAGVQPEPERPPLPTQWFDGEGPEAPSPPPSPQGDR